MQPAAQKVLAEYDRRSAREHALAQEISGAAYGKRRDEFLLSVGPDTALFMATLVRAMRARTLLEIGTSYGYSTLWLADAAHEVGGTLHTLELAKDKSDYARERIARAGLAKTREISPGRRPRTDRQTEGAV